MMHLANGGLVILEWLVWHGNYNCMKSSSGDKNGHFYVLIVYVVIWKVDIG